MLSKHERTKIVEEILLLRRFISYGYDIAFNSACTKEEEDFIMVRKNKTKENIIEEIRERIKLLK